MIPFHSLDYVYKELGAELEAATRRVMQRGNYILGEEVEAFEKEFAEYCGVEHCVAVGNGLDALTLVLRAWGVGPGDEVIVPSNTYIATWLAVSRCGATPVPVEPCLGTYNMDPSMVEGAITGRTRVLLPVHLYGQPAEMKHLLELAEVYGLRVLEDCAQAHGARYYGARVGSLGNAGAFSFYPSKNLGCLGDGGGVTTNDPDLAQALRSARNYGSRVKYHNLTRGVNSRLDELQAAYLRVRLRTLEDTNLRRVRLAQDYIKGLGALGSLGAVTQASVPGTNPVWHQFVIRLPDRDALRAYLTRCGVEVLIHYPVPPHLQPAYSDLGFRRGSFPLSEEIHDTVLSLPFGPGMSQVDQLRVLGHLADYEGQRVAA
jgi:dTDP-4-amino-4,6-dideoxygalactose transaminase